MHGWRTRSWMAIGLLATSAGLALADGASWPGLRGPDYDGAARSASLFHDKEQGLAIGWKKALGSGYSAVAVADGRAVTMFSSGPDDVLAGFDVESGEELWRYRIEEAYAGHDGSHDGPISTPLIAGGRVFGLSPRGRLFAVDVKTGKELWAQDLVEKYGAQSPYYGFASSPAYAEDVLILEIGAGEGKTIAGFEPSSGTLLWSAGDDVINYQSAIAATVDGKVMVIAVGDKKLFGLEPRSGAVLFTYEHQGNGGGMGASSMIPVPAGDGRFLLMNKSDASTMLKIGRGKEVDYDVQELWSTNGLKASYVMPVYRDGYLYGMNGRIFTCVDAATGETKWRSREPGDGFPTLVGDHLVVITKPGSLHVLDASPDGYREVAQLDLFEEHSWSQVAFAGGHLFARSMAHLARVDVTSAASEGHAANWLASTEFGQFLAEVQKAPDKAKVVDAWMAKQTSFPVIEGPDIVHFIYRGDATDVGIVGDLIGYRREDPMTRVAGTDLFYYSARLEPTAAVTYGFLKDYEAATPDPRNPRPGKGLFGEVSWFSMPAWPRPSVTGEAPAARQGRLEEVAWESKVREGAKRTAQVYLPAGFDASHRYPVAYVHNGKEALEEGGMKNLLDNLIGTQVEPMIAVFIIADEENRGDIAEADTYMRMVVEELVPLIDAKYPTIAERRGRANVGMGSAGAASLYGSFKYSDVFGRVATLSPVWFIDAEKPMEEIVSNADEQPLSIYMGWGTYDLRSPHEAWSMPNDNRKIWTLLRDRGFRPAGGEAPDGFGWGCWADRTGDLFTALFPATEGA